MGTTKDFATFDYLEGKQRRTSPNVMAGDICMCEIVGWKFQGHLQQAELHSVWRNPFFGLPFDLGHFSFFKVLLLSKV